MTFHVVCHDCPTEEVTDTEVEAAKHYAYHLGGTGHDVEYAEVDQ